MNLLVNRRLFPVPIVDINTNVLFNAQGQPQGLSLRAQGKIHSKHHLDIVGATTLRRPCTVVYLPSGRLRQLEAAPGLRSLTSIYS